MDRNEFVSWVNHHRALFPDWLGKRTISPETLKGWHGVMVPVSLQFAEAASGEMLAGIIDRPRTVEDHIRVIARRALEMAAVAAMPNEIRDERYRCPLCNDSGYVSVLHPRAMILAQEGAFDQVMSWLERGAIGVRPSARGLTSASVFCVCKAGKFLADAEHRQIAEGRPVSRLPIFDDEKFVRWSARPQEMLEMLQRAKAMKPSNYQVAFDEFNS